MKLEIDLDNMDGKKIDALISALTAWRMARFEIVASFTTVAPVFIKNAQPVEASITGSSAPAAPSPAGEPAGSTASAQPVAADDTPTSTATEAVTEKPKRKAKAQAAVEPEQKSTAPISRDDLREALQRLTSEKGMEAGIALLKSFDCVRVSELAAMPEATKRAFLEECPDEKEAV